MEKRLWDIQNIEMDYNSDTMGVRYRSTYPCLPLNRDPLGAEPLVKEHTPSAAGAVLMTLWCHMSNLITCWVDWHFRGWHLATALPAVDAHLACEEANAKCWKPPLRKKKNFHHLDFQVPKPPCVFSYKLYSDCHLAIWEQMMAHTKPCWSSHHW